MPALNVPCNITYACIPSPAWNTLLQTTIDFFLREKKKKALRPLYAPPQRLTLMTCHPRPVAAIATSPGL